ncbi:PREDICTED: mediator of RNA polymerase II transcription subunit 14-like [Rhagoletis zephyria]|uniref:mediator of RNA polymerase II transcription subunit 14-like n=1 Tax=Rhagoletis zephyria TaxID=28612 RepID=UPI0008114484|nr:PREDICTED: mediator of RNA polymerase II transcription subunit 14-like [Rhagoletis zephyria]
MAHFMEGQQRESDPCRTIAYNRSISKRYVSVFYECLSDGKALVHQLQVNYIHQLIQARVVENPNALSEVYYCLHYFCQSLQLKVPYTQTRRLSYERLDDNIAIEEYVPGVKIIAHTGMLKCHVPKHLDCPIMPEM